MTSPHGTQYPTTLLLSVARFSIGAAKTVAMAKATARDEKRANFITKMCLGLFFRLNDGRKGEEGESGSCC